MESQIKGNLAMKSLLFALLVTAPSLAAFAQGTVNFANLDSDSGLDAPMYLGDGTTKISGSGYMAELLAGPAPDNLSAVATTGFLTGVGAGYFQGGVVTISSLPPGAAAGLVVQ